MLLCRIPDFFHEQVPIVWSPSLKISKAAVGSLGSKGLCCGLAPCALELVLPCWDNATGLAAATVSWAGIPCQQGDALLQWLHWWVLGSLFTSKCIVLCSDLLFLPAHCIALPTVASSVVQSLQHECVGALCWVFLGRAQPMAVLNTEKPHRPRDRL